MFFEEDAPADRAAHDPDRGRCRDRRPRRQAAEAERTDDDREAISTFESALAELESLQTDDFAGLFRCMDGLPVVIRLIDPPLHEFLPSHEELIADDRLRTPRARGGGPCCRDRRSGGWPSRGPRPIFGKKDARGDEAHRARARREEPRRPAGARGRAGREGPSCSTRSRRCASRTRCSGCAASAWADGARHREDADPGDPRRGRPRGGRGQDAAARDHDPARRAT